MPSETMRQPNTTDVVADEADLVRRAKRDAAAFGPLYDAYVDAVYGYCMRRLNDPDDAADLTGLIFTRALAALPRFQETSASFRSWLFQIAHNAVIDRWRASSPVVQLDDRHEAIPHRAPGPEAVALTNERSDALYEAMSQLTDQQREIVSLRLAGLTGPEIAAATGMSHGAVKSSQFRAYAQLRRLLEPVTE